MTDRRTPHVAIVDKALAGARGEVVPVLEVLRESGCSAALGLRDIDGGRTGQGVEVAA